jgi:hypothetical protein
MQSVVNIDQDYYKKRIEEEKEAEVFINKTRKMFKEQGRDFWKEFAEWKKANRK